MITFVIFHVELPNSSGEQEKYHKHLIARQAYDYTSLCDITFRSAALFHPECRKVILTDIVTQFPVDTIANVEIIRREIDPQNMMFERMYAQFEFLKQYDFQGDVFFLDSDMIVNGSWHKMLAEEFDIGLTYDVLQASKTVTDISHDGKGGYMPINGGVIIVKKQYPERALSFFENLLSEYRKGQLIQHKGWWGDQHALIHFIGIDEFTNRKSNLIEVCGIRVNLFVSDIFNYAPRNRIYSLLKPFKVKLLHFRGSRKALMPLYWQAHLEPKEKKIFSLFLKNKLKLYACGLKELVSSINAKRSDR